MKFKNILNKSILLFVVMSLVVATNVTFAFAEGSGSVTVTFDAGYGRFPFKGGPHIQKADLTIGEKYPANFLKPENVHRDGHSCCGWFYYTDNHEKVSVDENSIVSEDATHIYAEWEAVSPDKCSSLLFNGSSIGHKDFVIRFYNDEGTDKNYIDKIVGDIRKYCEFPEELIRRSSGMDHNYAELIDTFCELPYDYETEELSEEVSVCIDPLDVYEKTLIIKEYKQNGDPVRELLVIPHEQDGALDTFSHWEINNTRIEPGTDYSFRLFDPNVNLECYAVYNNDEINLSVTGGTGHQSYEVLYEDGLGSSKTIQSSLDLNMFAGRDFYYRYNKDSSLEIWFGNDDEICQQHYTIKPISQDGYAFNSWAFNGAAVPVDKRMYCNLDEVVATGSHSQAFTSNYSVYKSKPVPTGDSENAIFYGIVTLLALLGVGFVYGLKRKEEK